MCCSTCSNRWRQIKICAYLYMRKTRCIPVTLLDLHCDTIQTSHFNHSLLLSVKNISCYNQPPSLPLFNSRHHSNLNWIPVLTSIYALIFLVFNLSPVLHLCPLLLNPHPFHPFHSFHPFNLFHPFHPFLLFHPFHPFHPFVALFIKKRSL